MSKQTEAAAALEENLQPAMISGRSGSASGRYLAAKEKKFQEISKIHRKNRKK